MSQISPEEATGGRREGRKRWPSGASASAAGAEGAGGSSGSGGSYKRGGRYSGEGGVLRISLIISLKSNIM